MGESHDQYRTLGGVTWPIKNNWVESHDQYRTLWESHDEYHTYFESRDKIDSSHTRNTVTVIGSNSLARHLQWLSSMHPTWLKMRSGCIYFISMALWAKVTVSFASLSLDSPSCCESTHVKVSINQSTEGSAVRELMVLGMQSGLTIQHSANAACCIAISTAPLVPLVHV